jgi:16S rRNA (uracil1498-N3)-methyltransferase
MKFFLPFTPDETFTIEGGDATHIVKSLRKMPGDIVTFCHSGFDFGCEITDITRGVITFRVVTKTPVSSEPNISVTLFLALPKQDKLDLVTEKCTEIGVSEFIPFLCERVIPSPRDFSKKRERLARIAESAAKQSGRGVIPTIGGLMSFENMCKSLSGFDLVLFCYENGGERLESKLFEGKNRIAVIIGAEGGFSADEAAELSAAGVMNIWLGERILRCETAPIAVSSVIMNLTGNL